ncbi:MAG: hypothetical protein ABEJ31_04415 [Haloarculaceae archaeon]
MDLSKDGDAAKRDQSSAPATDADPDSLIDRRDYLRLAGGAAALAGAGTLATGTAAAQTVRGVSFDREVDLVADFGADNTGSRPADDALDRALQPNTLVHVPAGRYLLHRKHVLDGGVNYGIVGEGDVTFVPKTGGNYLTFDSSARNPVNQVVFENVDYDITADNTVTGMRFNTRNGLHVENVEYVGRGTHTDTEVANAITITIANPDATGVLKDFTAKQGSTWARYKIGDGRVGVAVFPPHQGTLQVIDPHLEEFGNNAMYCSRHHGKVQVQGGIFRNNNVDGVRISGQGSWVDGAYFEVDPDSYTGPREDTYESKSWMMRGVRIEARHYDKTPGAEVRNCDFVMKNGPGVGSAVKVESNAKSVIVRDSRIRYDKDGRAAVMSEPNGYPIVMDGVSITGSASGGAAVLAPDSPNTSITGCCIQQTGANRDGVRFSGSDGCTVADTNISVTGQAIDVSNSTVDTSNVTHGDACPLPNGPDGTGAADSGSGSTGGTTDGSGSGTTDGATDPVDHALSISGGSPTNVIEYAFAVSDAVEKSTANGGTISDEDVIDGTAVTGAIAGGTDSYAVTGDLTALRVGGDATVTLDGQAIDPSQYPDSPPSDSGTSGSDGSGSSGGTDGGRTAGPSVVAYETPDGGDLVHYQFTVEGSVEKRTNADALSAELNDAIADNGDGTYTVSGATGNGFGDSYRLTDWVITDFSTDAGPDQFGLTLDGEAVTPDELTSQPTDGGSGSGSTDGSTGSATDLPSTLVLDGTQSGATSYEVTVSGDLAADPNGPALESDDSIDGSTATGSVDGEKDALRFSGHLTSLRLDGYASVQLTQSKG